jgi:hypothetical protein
LRKTLLVAGATMLFGGAFLGTAYASATSAQSCVPASAATYKHAFDGPAGTATITSAAPLCDGERQAFTLVSYTAPAKSFGNPQFVYATHTATVTAAKPSVTLRVDVPGCFTQVDAIFGTGVINPIVDGGPRYGATKVGDAAAPGSRSAGVRAWYNGGSTTCAPMPTATFASACDGTLTAHLANAPAANVDAVFALGGRIVRVAPGGEIDVPAGGKQVTVQDNTFSTVQGSWTEPSSCTGAAPSTSVSASASPSVSPSASAAPSVPESASASASVPSASGTATARPSGSTSGTATATPSASASRTAAPSSSVTGTATPSASGTATVLPSASASPTSATPSASAPQTNSPIETVTEITPDGDGDGSGDGDGDVVMPSAVGVSPGGSAGLPVAGLPVTGLPVAGLPVTGANATVLGGAAAFMILFGGVLILLSRRAPRGRHAA